MYVHFYVYTAIHVFFLIPLYLSPNLCKRCKFEKIRKGRSREKELLKTIRQTRTVFVSLSSLILSRLTDTKPHEATASQASPGLQISWESFFRTTCTAPVMESACQGWKGPRRTRDWTFVLKTEPVARKLTVLFWGHRANELKKQRPGSSFSSIPPRSFFYMHLKGVFTGSGNCRRLLKMVRLLTTANMYWALTRCQELFQVPNMHYLLTYSNDSRVRATAQGHTARQVVGHSSNPQGLAREPRLFTSVPRHVPDRTGPPAPCSSLNCRMDTFHRALVRTEWPATCRQ